MTRISQQFDSTALGVRVHALESNIGELKTSISAIDVKIDKFTTDISRDTRMAIEALSTQLNERQRTPWMAIFAGAAVLVSLFGFYGQQALSPLQTSVLRLEANLVTRAEQDRFNAVEAKRIAALDSRLLEVQHDYMRTRDFDVQHNDLKRAMDQTILPRDKIIEEIDRRLSRLEELWLKK